MSDPPSIAVVFGAGGGIGGGIVRRLVEQGAYDHVVGVGRRRPSDWGHDDARPFLVADILHDAALADAALFLGELGSVRRVVVATGFLHGEGIVPEKSIRSLEAATLLKLFAVNAVGPALIAKHLLPLLPRDRPCAFAALSARVGSISDNRLGGWYGYRASKAALNMLIATLAVELRRTHPQATCVALHPGTVESRLSAPFAQGTVSTPRLTPRQSAKALMEVLDRLTPEDSGGFYAHDGSTIPW
jgi:NAD(P)-dependent dehydrogenase (short-subunit alcohol dehydrogenase family)